MCEVIFRYATENDVPKILFFIKELASYEKMLNEVVATEELLREWIFALVLIYLINLLISFLAFWLTEVTSFFFVKDLVVDFLSGKAFPIDIMPIGVLGVFNLLPFAYCTFFPINILTKDLTFLELMRGFGMQLGWILVIYVMVRIAWKRGIKRYSGTGM